MSKKSHINTTDLQGYTRIITDATLGITELVKEVQHRIVHPPYLPTTPFQRMVTGISHLVFQGIIGVTNLVGSTLDQALARLHPLVDQGVDSNEKETIHAVLNGVIGDYLEDSNNPLSIPMQLRYQGQRLALDANSIHQAYPKISGKLLLMVHGLCMTDTHWLQNDHHHGEALARELNLNTLYLYYNTGRHISTNGQELNTLLEQVVTNWPVPVEELLIVAHSMGGLVSRSAAHYATENNSTWLKYLKKMVFLGTPHHGAPFEQAGNHVNILLEAAPYAKPFARLGKIRSAGITDLRYGNLVDEDWRGLDRFNKGVTHRKPIPLPKDVASYVVAATTAKEGKGNWLQGLNDGLVTLESALGQHKQGYRHLPFPKSRTLIVYESGHVGLLGNQETYDRLRTWLSA